MHHDHVPLGTVVKPWFVGQKNTSTKQRSGLDPDDGTMVSMGFWIAGRGRQGAILVLQRWQWNVEKFRVTSALRLYDATNAYLSMYCGSAKKAAEGHAAVHGADEETSTDILVGSGTSPSGFCAPRIFVKATCDKVWPMPHGMQELGR